MCSGFGKPMVFQVSDRLSITITRNTGLESRLSIHLQKSRPLDETQSCDAKKQTGEYQPNPSASQNHHPKFTSENPGSHPISKPQALPAGSTLLPRAWLLFHNTQLAKKSSSFQAETDASWGSLTCRLSALFLSQMGHGSEKGWRDTSGTCGKLAKFMGKNRQQKWWWILWARAGTTPCAESACPFPWKRRAWPHCCAEQGEAPPSPPVTERWPCHHQSWPSNQWQHSAHTTAKTSLPSWAELCLFTPPPRAD